MSGTIAELRQYRIAGMAIFDWVTSLLGGILIGYFILENHSVALWTMWLIVWILIGIVIHLLVGVDTMLGYYLGLNKKPVRGELNI
jgi:hypothetical protein